MRKNNSRSAKSTYARQNSTITGVQDGTAAIPTAGTPATLPAPGVVPLLAAAASPDASSILLALSEQMQVFAEGLQEAHKAQRDFKIALDLKSTETAQAIADSKAEAVAESKCTIARLQQQLAFYSQSAYVFKREGNEAQYIWKS